MNGATSSLGFGLETRRALAGLGVAFGILTLVLGVILLMVVVAQCSRHETQEEEEEEEELRPVLIMSHKRD
jgi:hypothetical protein